MAISAKVESSTQSDAPAYLSEEWQECFDADSARLDPEMQQKMKLYLRMAYTRGRSQGFATGIDKGADIANGGPKMRAAYPTEEVPAQRTGEDWSVDEILGPHFAEEDATALRAAKRDEQTDRAAVLLATIGGGCVLVEQLQEP